MNVPSRKCSPSKCFFGQLRMMAVAIIAPEYVFAIAAVNFLDAWILLRRSRDWPESFFEVR
jgi:hypothetical protein